MEVTNIKYSSGKIYTIRSYQTDKFYIGSTTQPLHKRLYEHRKNYETKLLRGSGRMANISSFEIIKYSDNYIELLEEYPCSNKQQLNKREGELMREHKKNCINKRIEGRTDKEYNEDNKEKIKLYEIKRREIKKQQRYQDIC